MTRKRFTVRDARSVLARIGRKLPRGATLRDLARGMTVELEHRDVTRGDAVLSARIAMAHLRERPDYYALIDKLERAPRARRNPKPTKYVETIRRSGITWFDPLPARARASEPTGVSLTLVRFPRALRFVVHVGKFDVTGNPNGKRFITPIIRETSSFSGRVTAAGVELSEARGPLGDWVAAEQILERARELGMIP